MRFKIAHKSDGDILRFREIPTVIDLPCVPHIQAAKNGIQSKPGTKFFSLQDNFGV